MQRNDGRMQIIMGVDEAEKISIIEKEEKVGKEYVMDKKMKNRTPVKKKCCKNIEWI